MYLMGIFAVCPDLILSSIKFYNSYGFSIDKKRLSKSCNDKTNLCSVKKFGMLSIMGIFFTLEDFTTSNNDLV